MTKSEIESKYNEVGCVLQDSLSKAKSINLLGEEEKNELTDIVSRLENINTEFQSEIEKLESSSEWEKFCIAFFGETNAGKSTIIESLRIIYNEKTRQVEMMNHNRECELLLAQDCNDYKNLLETLNGFNRYLFEMEQRKKTQAVVQVLKSIGLVLIGFVIAFILSFIGLI